MLRLLRESQRISTRLAPRDSKAKRLGSRTVRRYTLSVQLFDTSHCSVQRLLREGKSASW